MKPKVSKSVEGLSNNKNNKAWLDILSDFVWLTVLFFGIISSVALSYVSIKGKIDRLDERLTQVENRLDNVEEKIRQVQHEIIKLK